MRIVNFNNIIVDNMITVSFQHHYAQIIDIKR